MVLSDIVNDFIAEDYKTECKLKLNEENAESWLKSIAAFANSQGGDLYVGVEDRNSQLVGFSYTEIDTQRNVINNIVNEHIFPIPFLEFTFIPYMIRDKERYIVKVHIPESPSKPVEMKYKGHVEYFKRKDGFTTHCNLEDIRYYVLNTTYTPFEKGISLQKYNRKNFSRLLQTFREANNNNELTDKALESIGFFDENKILCNGAVLFSDNYDGELTKVKIMEFPGFNAGTAKATAIKEYSGNIIETIQFIRTYVLQKMNRSFEKLSSSRRDYEAFPERALFEGIVNAVAHRDYWDDNSQIEVYMYKDRLEITSPGTIYKRKEKYGKYYDFSRLISVRRNQLITEVLVKCKMMEASGTGFDKIIASYKDVDDKHKPYIYLKPGCFTLVLPDLTYEEGTDNSNLPQIEYIPQINQSKYDEMILRFCCMESKQSKDIAKSIDLADSSYFRNTILKRLVENNLLIEIKEGKTVFYKANMEKVFIVGK